MHFHCLLQAFLLLLRESSPRGKVLSGWDVLFVELVPADPPPRQARCTICLVQAAHEKGEDRQDRLIQACHGSRGAA